MDNPNLDQALDTAWDNTQDTSDLVEGQASQPETPEVTTPEVVDGAVEAETPKKEEKPEQAEKGEGEVEDKFTNVDPETLPEELKAIYKSLQADYTKKRQSDSAKVKEIEERLKAQEATEGEEQDLSNLTPEEIKEIARQEVIDKQSELWRVEAVGKLEQIDPRLNENHPEYEKTAWLDEMVRSRLDQELALYEQENGSPVGFDTEDRAKKLISQIDGYVEEKSKAYLQKQSLLAQEKSKKLQKASPEVTNPTTKRSGSMSLDDAIDSAFENS